jgi:hypothetical protein
MRILAILALRVFMRRTSVQSAVQ